MSWAEMAARLETSVFSRLSDGQALFIAAGDSPCLLTYIIITRDVQTAPIAFDAFNEGEKTTVASFRKSEIAPTRPASGDQIIYEDETFRIREILRDDGYEYTVSVIAEDA